MRRSWSRRNRDDLSCFRGDRKKIRKPEEERVRERYELRIFGIKLLQAR